MKTHALFIAAAVLTAAAAAGCQHNRTAGEMVITPDGQTPVAQADAQRAPGDATSSTAPVVAVPQRAPGDVAAPASSPAVVAPTPLPVPPVTVIPPHPSSATGPSATGPDPAGGSKVIVTATGPVVVMPPTHDRTPFVTPVYVAADADEATRLRNWPVSENYYASGHFIAGPVYVINAPPPRSDRISDIVAVELFQTPISAFQALITPIWAVFTPPLTPVEYHGEQNPPSYTVDDVTPFYPPNEKVPGTVNMRR
jgi:hypothetical protein